MHRGIRGGRCGLLPPTRFGALRPESATTTATTTATATARRAIPPRAIAKRRRRGPASCECVSSGSDVPPAPPGDEESGSTPGSGIGISALRRSTRLRESCSTVSSSRLVPVERRARRNASNEHENADEATSPRLRSGVQRWSSKAKSARAAARNCGSGMESSASVMARLMRSTRTSGSASDVQESEDRREFSVPECLGRSDRGDSPQILGHRGTGSATGVRPMDPGFRSLNSPSGASSCLHVQGDFGPESTPIGWATGRFAAPEHPTSPTNFPMPLVFPRFRAHWTLTLAAQMPYPVHCRRNLGSPDGGKVGRGIGMWLPPQSDPPALIRAR